MTETSRQHFQVRQRHYDAETLRQHFQVRKSYYDAETQWQVLQRISATEIFADGLFHMI